MYICDIVILIIEFHPQFIFSTSAVLLHRHHVEAHSKAKKAKEAKFDSKKLIQPQSDNSTFRIMLEVENFYTTKIKEGILDLVFSIYEVSNKDSPKQLCETFIIEDLDHSAAPIIKQSVIFEGISKTDIKQIFLVCNVHYTQGSMLTGVLFQI